MRSYLRTAAFVATGLLLSVVSVQSAQAHVIERIEINRNGNEAEIQIQFDVRIQYLREASLKNGEVHVFINLLETDPDRTVQVPEAMDSPPSNISPHFRASYPGLDSSLTIKFDNPVTYRVRAGKDGRSISIFTPVIMVENATATEAQTAFSTPEEVELEAKRLMGIASEAVAQDQAVKAIETLNQLLNLPPNQQSQAAQELIGDAREKNGEYDKARVEYELYLKLYPDAKGLNQVKAKLAGLPKESYVKPVKQPEQKRSIDEKMMVFGSVSQSYYNGVSHTDTTTSNGLGSDSFSGTDQSMLISSLDMTARKRTESTDTRLVLRDDHRANFLSGSRNDNRLTSLYVEQSARDRSYLVRLGRQSGLSGGVLGRFDGAWMGYDLNPTWRVNGVLGTPVDYYRSSDSDRKTFAGISVDLTRLPEQWSGSGYFIEQRAGTVVDRQAVGMDAHYFDAHSNYMGMFDYDRLFKAVNIAMFQGNWTTAAGDNYLMLIDHRKSPSLQLSNAVLGQPIQSLVTLVQSGVSKDSLISDAKALTPTANLLMVGLTHPYTPRLRVGGDFRVSNTSGSGAVGTQPATPGTGNVYIYSAQLIANSLLLENDLGLASASIINAQTYKGQSLTLTQTETLRQRWRLDVSLQLYNQKDNTDVHQTRITPSLKLSYRWNESVNFDAEGGIEDTHTTSTSQDQKVRRKYVYLGYRWDFQ